MDKEKLTKLAEIIANEAMVKCFSLNKAKSEFKSEVDLANVIAAITIQNIEFTKTFTVNFINAILSELHAPPKP